METKKSKSLLVRLFTVLAVLCCCLSLVFGLVGCGAEAKGIKSTSINAQGELIVTYTDGSTDNLGVVVGKDGSQGPQGPQGPTGPQGSAAAWSEVCPEAEDGKHATVKHIVTFGTCTEAETTLEICVNCQASKLNVGELNADNHGSYSWVDIGGVMVIVFDDTCVVDIPGSEFEEANGACPKQECTACGEVLLQHAETEWVDVIEPGVNPCEERHLEVKTCVDCHAIVTEATLVEAKGHDYEQVNVEDANDIIIDGVTYATKTVTLVCQNANCAKEIKVTAIEINKVAPTCKAKGYTVFEYTYNDFLADHTVTFQDDEVNAATFHRIPGTELSYEQNSAAHFNPVTTAALEAAIADGSLEWTVAGVGNCSTSELAVYDCADCKTPVIINLYGKHPSFTTVPATCLVDGTTTCDAGCGYSYVSAYATGHNYVYVANSFDASANTAKVKCACGAEKTVDVVANVFHEADTCASPAYYTYTTASFDNGLAASHVNYATKVVSFNIFANVPVAHNVGTLKIVQGTNVEFTPAIKALIEAGKIRWTVAGAANCSSYEFATFDCATCGTPVVFYLSGEHDLDATKVATVEAGCTTRGTVSHFCNGCAEYIEVSSSDAKGHTFVVDSNDLVNLVVGSDVTYNCACGESVEIKVKEVIETTIDTECVTTDRTTYTFETYEYTVETAVVGVNKTLEFTPNNYVVDDSIGTHKVGDLRFVQGNNYEHNPAIAALIEAGKIRWTVAGEAPCNQYYFATFDCETCKTPVVINLSGVHNIVGQPDNTVAADCLNDGHIYKDCVDCGADVIMSILPATGHKFETYTVIGAADGNPGYAKSVCANANCPGEDNATPAEDIVAGVEVIDIDENCGFDGKVVYTYVKDGVKVCEDVTFVRPATGNHDADQEPKVKFVKDGYEYICFYCEGCEQYVVLSKNPIA